jgi:predicted metal-dependent hydrolase
MENQLKTQNQPISYKVRMSARAKRMRISVGCEAGVVVTLPWGFNESAAKEFVRQKQNWIFKSLEYFERFKGRVFLKSGKREYVKNKVQALELAKRKILQWNAVYGFVYNRVSIKNQKTRWGSCSKKGSLNFNYKIIRLPEYLTDYLVVHELCHLKEFNHSKKFWELVGQTMPNYKILRRELRSFGVRFS